MGKVVPFRHHEHHGDGMLVSPRYRLYVSWCHMRYRCTRPSNTDFADYGGRGITVHEAWDRSFASFREWSLANGWEPGLEIDRIDNDGNYEPGNCRWVARSRQMRNTRVSVKVTAFGETKSVHDWAEDPRCKVDGKALGQRIRRGMDPEWSIVTPSRNPNSGRRARA